MLTKKEQKLVDWLRTRKVATMRHLKHQFQVSHMTVFRAFKKQGYHTSYNRNAAYYTLADVPEFDEWGLWAYRDVRFSRFGSLPDTLVGLVEQAPAGLTCDELEDRLQTQVPWGQADAAAPQFATSSERPNSMRSSWPKISRFKSNGGWPSDGP